VSNECRETTNGHGGLTVLYLDGIFLDLRAAKSKRRESRAAYPVAQEVEHNSTWAISAMRFCNKRVR
jgi:hypothetical protein